MKRRGAGGALVANERVHPTVRMGRAASPAGADVLTVMNTSWNTVPA